MSEKIILESKKGKLMKDKFVYDGETYPLSDITNASVKTPFWGAPKLILEFKDGKIMEFMVGTLSTSQAANAVSLIATGGLVDNVHTELVSSTRQFATTINMLIAMQ